MGLILETSQKTIEARYSLIKRVSRLASAPDPAIPRPKDRCR